MLTPTCSNGMLLQRFVFLPPKADEELRQEAVAAATKKAETEAKAKADKEAKLAEIKLKEDLMFFIEEEYV